MIINCEKCKKMFKARPYLVKKGRGKYCSYKCYWEDRKGKIYAVPIIRKCFLCGEYFRTWPCHIKKGWGKYCSYKCLPQRFKKNQIPWNKNKKMPSGKNAYHYKGGKSHDMRGYVLTLNPSHPRADNRGYIKRSYLVLEKILKRHIKRGEVVHHKGINFPIHSIENRQDDSPENLQLFSNQSEHMKFHVNSKKSLI